LVKARPSRDFTFHGDLQESCACFSNTSDGIDAFDGAVWKTPWDLFEIQLRSTPLPLFASLWH
jgi:hypothetical protein